MKRRFKWQAGVAAAYAGMQVNQAIYQLVSKVFVAGDAACKKLSDHLRSSGYWVCEGKVGLKLLRHVRPEETNCAEPVDLLVLDATQDSQVALHIIEMVRMTDWALPIIVLVNRTDDDLEQELKRLGVTAWFNFDADVESIHTAISSLVPPIARARAAA